MSVRLTGKGAARPHPAWRRHRIPVAGQSPPTAWRTRFVAPPVTLVAWTNRRRTIRARSSTAAVGHQPTPAHRRCRTRPCGVGPPARRRRGRRPRLGGRPAARPVGIREQSRRPPDAHSIKRSRNCTGSPETPRCLGGGRSCHPSAPPGPGPSPGIPPDPDDRQQQVGVDPLLATPP